MSNGTGTPEDMLLTNLGNSLDSDPSGFVLLHSLQHLKTEVRNFAFFCDLSTATTNYLRLWRPATAFKIHSKGFKSNGEAL